MGKLLKIKGSFQNMLFFIVYSIINIKKLKLEYFSLKEFTVPLRNAPIVQQQSQLNTILWNQCCADLHILVTCASIFKEVSNITPRFLTDRDGWIKEFPTVTFCSEERYSLCEWGDAKMINSVLLSFIFNLLFIIQDRMSFRHEFNLSKAT